jgi:hypothetical protein
MFGSLRSKSAKLLSLPVEYLDGRAQTGIDIAISIHAQSTKLIAWERVHRAAIGVNDIDSIIARMSDDKAVWMGFSSCADEH